MGNVLLENLQSEIEAGDVIGIIGAGVSIGATVNQPAASWQGLLHNGVKRCLELRQLTGVDDEWAKRVHAEINSGDLDDMLSGAEKISRRLGWPKGGEYSRWLLETIGMLKAERRDVLEALRDLKIPLATTNYDGLIEEVSDLPAVTWMDGAKVERVLRGHEQGILHMHGYWDRSESVILGIRSYEQVLGDAHAQAMQRAIRSLKTMLFVGCGEGLQDPNFAALLEWTCKVFPGSEYRHFRLARQSEVAGLQAQHPREQRIVVLSYGDEHAELAPFLRRLRAAPERGKQRKKISPLSGQAVTLPPAPLCFGREAEIEDLVSTLLEPVPPPVPLLGPPGIGKTTVTLVAMNEPRVANRYGSRRFFVRCESATDRKMLVAEIARSIGLQADPNLEGTLLSILASAPVALAVDNAETPWEADTLPVEEFFAQMAALPGLALIASMRGATRPGAVRWRESIQPRQLPISDARKSFLAVAGEKFASDPHLDKLLRAVDGVPLAITLLGHASEGEPDLNGLWARWKRERTDVLRRAEANHPLLNIEVSYEISIKSPRMTPEALRLLSVMGFLTDGVAHGDLDLICLGCGIRAAAVLRKVGLAFDEAGRLRVLTPLREYLQKKSSPQPDHLGPVFAHYLTLAIDYGEKIGEEGGAEAISRLTPEMGNLEAIILRGLDEPQAELAIRAALSLSKFTRFTGLGTAAQLAKAVKITRKQDSKGLLANCIFRLGDLALARSDHETARKSYREALSIYPLVGDIYGQANCVYSLGEIALAHSEYDLARKGFEEALALYKSISEIRCQGNCISRLAEIALASSDHETSRKGFEDALLLYQRIGDLRGQANCVYSLGIIALNRSNHDIARKNFKHALPLYQRIGDLRGQANCIFGLGDVAGRRPEHETARSRFEEALSSYQRVGHILGQANCINRLGDIALALSQHQTARHRFKQALPLYRRIGDILGQANCIYSLGVISLERSAHESARKRFEEALPLFQRDGSILGQAGCMTRLGDIAMAYSDYKTATKQFEEALPLYQRMGAIVGQANCISRLGDIAFERSDYDTARKRFEKALPLYETTGNILGQANCIKNFGDIAVTRSDYAAAQELFEQALSLYEQVQEPYSIGSTHRRLCHIAQNDQERRQRVAAASKAWQSIGRNDLVKNLIDEFGQP